MDLTLCEQVKLYMKRNKIKAVDVAKCLGITSSNFSRKINANKLRCDEIDKISETFGFEVTIRGNNEVNI